MFYCEICDKKIINKSRNGHYKNKNHDYTKNYVTNIYNYSDIIWDDVENIIHDNIISHNNKFNDFRIYVLCKINNKVKINVYKSSSELHALLPIFLPQYKNYDVGSLYIQVGGKMICENLKSKYDINGTPDMKIRNLRIKFVSRYNNMTFRYQLEQPRRIIESKLIKHIKDMAEEEQDRYNFLVCKHKLFNI